ncbi:hypothetical protein, partial [Klebsiella pneumoniae]|uniref:hypothetical protein n=1 Tax=Klebsiella pneumoniae TaxID=573 RepID=UPI0013D2A715
RKRISRELALAYVKWVVITPDLFREPKPYNLDFRIPWTWLENEKTFEVCDGGGQSLGHTYFQTDDADQARQWITKQAA